MWVAHIPVISARTGVSHSQLGGLLLLLGVSAFVGMQLCGPLIDRWGSQPTTVAAAVLLSLAVLGPVSATGPVTLAVALAVFGFANGSLDVSMNAQAVVVEQIYARPIMSAFHGYFSVGSLIGSGIVAVTLWSDFGVVRTVLGATVLGIVATAVVARSLTGRPAEATDSASSSGPAGAWWRGVDVRRLVLLAVVAFALMLAEGTAYDWSALHVVEAYGAREAIGALTFGAFSAAMTVARFGVDRVAAVVGPVAVVRVGSLIGLVGMLLAIFAPTSAWAIVGWTVFGIGLAGLIPQIFTAAGNLTTEARGRSISLVVGCGYLGMLAGPAIVGFISIRTSLATALGVAVITLLIAIAAAGVVRPPENRA